MPDPRVLRRNALSGLLDVRRPFSGSLILPRSMPADRINCVHLEAITAKLGTMTSGTVISGNQHGAHMIFGDGARGGFAGFAAPNRPVCSFSPLDDGSFLLGPAGGPNVRMAQGNVAIDGDCNVDGTIRASKLLFVGGLSQALMTSDRLFIGGGDVDAGTQSGFLATFSRVGGWNNGDKTWEVHTRSGLISTFDTTNPDYIYTTIGAGLITISNLDDSGGMVDRHAIKFKGYLERYIDHGPIEPGEIVTFEVANVDMFASGDALTIKNTLGTWGASIHLQDGSGGIRGTWSGQKLELYDTTRSQIGWIEQKTNGALRLASLGGHISLSTGSGGVAILDGDYNMRLDGLSLAFRSGTAGWPARAAIPSEGDHRYDAVNHREEFYNGTEWRYLDDSAA